MWNIIVFSIILFGRVGTIISQSQNDCSTYSVTHIYGSKGVETRTGTAMGGECCQKGETGRPGKAGAPGTGQKGEPGAPGVWVNTRNYWTRTSTGCQCYFNHTREDCACCYPGSCQCTIRHPSDCVPCGQGQFCGIKELPRSCEFIDETQSGVYLISPDPDRYQPFYVYCDFTSRRGKTLIKHDSLLEIEAKKCENARCSVHRINYNAPLPQIEALIAVSHSCRQFVKYRCKGSVLFQNKDFFSTWVSRDGTEQRYWGGATSRRDWHCACGENSTCVDSTKLCNCDINDGNQITSDEGYLTDKSKLPIIAVKFGDLGDSGERGWHTIGSLECHGRA